GGLEFKDEIELLSRVHHKNLWPLELQGTPILQLYTGSTDARADNRNVKVVRNSIDKIEKFVDLAMMCLEESGADRPPMSDVVKEIKIILHSIGLDPAAESEPSTSSSFQH
ncbi:hypothetical protein HN51_004785, partial [Arachis hypogaea]